MASVILCDIFQSYVTHCAIIYNKCIVGYDLTQPEWQQGFGK